MTRSFRSHLTAAPLSAALVAVLAALVVLAGPAPARAHEVPARVNVIAFVKPDGDRLRVLVRVPLEAIRDVEWPLYGPGYLELERARPLLPEAAQIWIADYLEFHEGATRLDTYDVVATRISLPSDASFREWPTALAHTTGPPLADGTEIMWQQALFDVLLEYPIADPGSDFSVWPALAHLGITTTTALRFLPGDDVDRAFQYTGDPASSGSTRAGTRRRSRS
jgi:hypothetical protein